MRVARQRIALQRKLPWKGSQHNIQHPGATSKRNYMSSPPNSATEHGPFSTYLERSSLRMTDYCGYGKLGSHLHFATSCPLVSSFHLTKSSNDLKDLWLKRVLDNPLSRIMIRKLINFIFENEDILFPPN
ncbi:hypothetical protein AVEN_179719-1 [Araneus ventricosus]|uniref:Uncharacterized protein n=1 Tax=Araneus ventricosus TaxID=182803 RepID=A0A4Y2T1Q0_ARAVE|nr:hypothetical protein AVEN_179719-1 [Araneus ventricosus]